MEPALPSPAETWLTRLLVGLNGIGSVWIFVLMLVINTDAFSRTLFTAPIYGVNEIIELSIVAIVFLQLGDALRNRRLTRSDGFFNLALERVPALGRAMGALFDLLVDLFPRIDTIDFRDGSLSPVTSYEALLEDVQSGRGWLDLHCRF